MANCDGMRNYILFTTNSNHILARTQAPQRSATHGAFPWLALAPRRANAKQRRGRADDRNMDFASSEKSPAQKVEADKKAFLPRPAVAFRGKQRRLPRKKLGHGARRTSPLQGRQGDSVARQRKWVEKNLDREHKTNGARALAGRTQKMS